MVYDKTILREILSETNFRTVDSDGRVLPPSNDVFAAVADEMTLRGSGITKKHVHTIVNNNRNNIRDMVLNIFYNKKKNTDVKYEPPPYDLNLSAQSTDSESSLLKIRFKLVISSNDWAPISPRPVIYGTRTYYVLEPGAWTDLFAKKIWDQKKITCAFSFKRDKVCNSSDAAFYCHFKATCNECSSILDGFLYKKPAKNADAVFDCTLEGPFARINHSKKRHLTRERRDQVASKLLDGRIDAITWRCEESKSLMQFGDKIAPMLYDATVLRKAKEEQSLKRLKFSTTDPIENLRQAKYRIIPTSIHEIGVDPFFVEYWSEEQIVTYKLAIKNDSSSYMTVDATGGVCRTLKLPNGEKSPHIFLYQCVCVTKDGSFPAFQMLSARQDAVKITAFLSDILREGAPKPRLVVCDFGLAILIAIARTFADCRNLTDYMQACYDVAVLRSSKKLPTCYIRLDVSHLIAMVARWPCLKGKMTKFRQFFIRCIAQAYQMQDFKDVERFLKSVLVVALSETTGRNENGTNVPSEDHLQIANGIIRGTTDDATDEPTMDDSESTESSDPMDDDLENDAGNGWVEWSKNLFKEAEDIAARSHNGITVNAFYSPEVAKKLRSLIAYVAIWTGLLSPHFKQQVIIATSSSVESEFSNMKCRGFKGELPMRADKFVVRHLDYIEGKLHLTAGKSFHRYKQTAQSIVDDNSNASEWNEVEDWRGLGKTNGRKAKEAVELRCVAEKNGDRTVVSLKDDSEVHLSDRSFALIDSLNDDSNLESGAQTGQSINNSVFESVGDDDKNSEFCVQQPSENTLTLKTIEQESNPQNRDKNSDDTSEVCVQQKPPKNTSKRNTTSDETSTHQQTEKTPARKKRKFNYLDKCADWDIVKSNHISFGTALLKNGNLMAPIVVRGRALKLQNTCAFDSLMQILINSIAVYETYKQEIESAPYEPVKFALSILESGKLNRIHYETRAKLLSAMPIFDVTQRTRYINALNAKCNSAHLVQFMFRSMPSVVTSVHCLECAHKNTRNLSFLSINVDIIFEHGFAKTQEAINDNILHPKTTCSNCKNSITMKTSYGPQLFIDTSVLTDPTYLRTKTGPQLRYLLGSIPRVIEVVGQTYYLAGVSSYCEQREHYVAIVYAGVSWHTYDDLRSYRTTSYADADAVPHVIMYVR